MNDLDVRMVRLEPVRVAVAHGFGASPEAIAWDKILTFAKSKELLDGNVRYFGFNNPDPSPGSPNYGYEQWITVGDEVEPEGDIEIKTFDGGLYAVTRSIGINAIGETWQRLVQWCEDSPHQFGNHQMLEECLTPPAPDGQVDEEQFTLDLYLPLAG